MGLFRRIFANEPAQPPARRAFGQRDRPLSSVNTVRDALMSPSLAFTPTQPKPAAGS